MTQELKDKALDILNRSTVDGPKLRLPDEEIDHEVWTVVKDALTASGAQYNKKTKVFLATDPIKALADAKAWLQEQDATTYDAPVLYDGPETVEGEEMPSDDEPKKEKKFIKERRTLKYNFTAIEVTDLAQQLATETRKVQSVEEEKAQTAAHYSAVIKEKRARQNNLSVLITNGYEMRDVECEVYYNQPSPGKKTIIRTDTMTADVQPMDREEFNLFNQPVDEEQYA